MAVAAGVVMVILNYTDNGAIQSAVHDVAMACFLLGVLGCVMLMLLQVPGYPGTCHKCSKG